jgi:choline dehydrogenase
MWNDEWTFEKCLPFFRKVETDTAFDDYYHGSNGPIIARSFKQEEWLPT